MTHLRNFKAKGKRLLCKDHDLRLLCAAESLPKRGLMKQAAIERSRMWHTPNPDRLQKITPHIPSRVRTAVEEIAEAEFDRTGSRLLRNLLPTMNLTKAGKRYAHALVNHYFGVNAGR